MAKKSLGLLFLELTVIFLWLFFVGQANGHSGIRGDVNLIDEGQFAAWINHMLHGKVIYKDFFVPYGPLQIYPLYFLIKMFGPSIFIIRFAMTVLGVFLGICAALIVLKYLRVHPFLRVITILFIVIIPGVHMRYWIGILCFMAISQAYKLKSLKLSFVAGALLGITFLQSTDVGILSILVVLGCVSVKKNARIAALTIFGFTFFLTIFAIFAFKEGWLMSYLQITANFLTSVSGVNLPNGQGLPNIFEGKDLSFNPIQILKFAFSKAMLFYWSLLLFLIFTAITIIRYILKKTTQRDEIIFFILCFGILIYASIIGRSGHYFILVPIVIVCASYFLTLWFTPKIMKENTNKIIGIIFLIIFILYGIRHIVIFRYTPFFDLSVRQFSNTSVPRIQPIAISENQAYDILALQDFFKRNTKPTDTIFVFNNIPALYFLLNRENSTWYDVPLLAISLKKRLELVSSLREHPPKFIIEDKKAWAVDGISDRQRLPEVINYIERNYDKIKLDNFILYSPKSN